MDLAKPSLDVGLYVTDVAASRTFYENEVGLPYEELLPVGGGVHQHRLGLLGSVLKLNARRSQLDQAPTGYRRMLVAGDAPRDLVDPDGLAVSIVEPGTAGVDKIGIEIASADPAAHARFLLDGLGAAPMDDGGYRIGTTVVLVREVPGTPRSGPLTAVGFRYLTIQVRDVVAAHTAVTDLGFESAVPPRKLGQVAAISFVRDPGGNWLEISQRASLTGPLPEEL